MFHKPITTVGAEPWDAFVEPPVGAIAYHAALDNGTDRVVGTRTMPVARLAAIIALATLCWVPIVATFALLA